MGERGKWRFIGESCDLSFGKYGAARNVTIHWLSDLHERELRVRHQQDQTQQAISALEQDLT
jgi:hypothetical protein